MIHYAILDQDGYPTETGTRFALPAGAVELPPQINAEAATRMRLDGGAWIARPEIPAPVITDGTLAFAGLPAGAVAEVIDGETGETLALVEEDAGQIEIELADSGPYQIEVEAPRPWLPWRGKVVLP